MSPERLALSSALLGLCLTAAAGAEEPQAPAGQATLPLARVLELVRDTERAREAPEPPAPVAAAVTQLRLKGRLLEDAVDVQAHVELSVLAEDAWVRVPILTLSPRTHLAELPAVPGGELLADRGELVFVTRAAGRYAFDLSLLQTAQADGRARRAELVSRGATLARLDLRWDEDLFRLLDEGARRGAEGASLFPRGDRFQVRWEPRTPAAVRPEREAEAARPPVESVIPLAHASSVVTLEGRRITRVRYELRFEGVKPISFRLPPGARVEKVHLNDAAAPFHVEGDQLALEVRPPRVGDQSGSLELTLVDAPGAFHLSGRLSLTLPAASWQVDELHVRLHLPAVFDYAWAGGSLALAEPGGQAASPAEPGWSHRIPTPGKALAFQQSLISSAPDVAVRYEVDLDGQIYRGGPATPSAVPEAAAVETGRWTGAE